MATTREATGSFGSFTLTVTLTGGAQFNGAPDFERDLEEHFADMIGAEAEEAAQALMDNKPLGVKEGVTEHRMQGGLGGGDGFDVAYQLNLRLLADAIPLLILLEVFETVEKIFQKEILKHLTSPEMGAVMMLMDAIGPELLDALQQEGEPMRAETATSRVDDLPGMYL